MRCKSWYSVVRMVTAATVGALCFTQPIARFVSLPGDIRVPQGERAVLPMNAFGRARVWSSDSTVADAKPVAIKPAEGNRIAQAVSVVGHRVGDATISTRLFGFLPWKTVQVHVVPQQNVYIGGQTIGVRIDNNGVLVVGYQRSGYGATGVSKIAVGDVVESVQGHPVRRATELAQWVRMSSVPLKLIVRRDGQRHEVIVNPAYDEFGRRHLGLYVRDKTAGIGTLTFYDPVHHAFGALGHMITDADTGQRVEGDGALYDSEVTGIVRGVSGRPGEKRGRFRNVTHALGSVNRNSEFGVFGEMDQVPPHPFISKRVPVALPNQVHPGPAQLLTVVHGQQVESFRVNVENLARQDGPSVKSMIIHVTDPRLLQETGGIVQGMSGSPILQDGRLIGAVTHVFLSDVTRGYGVYATWMLHEADEVTERSTDTRNTDKAAVSHMSNYVE